jgi:hypothetical protein
MNHNCHILKCQKGCSNQCSQYYCCACLEEEEEEEEEEEKKKKEKREEEEEEEKVTPEFSGRGEFGVKRLLK